MSMDTLMRASDNPFFPFVKDKLTQAMASPGAPAKAPRSGGPRGFTA